MAEATAVATARVDDRHGVPGGKRPVAEVADTVVALVRSFGRHKARYLAAAQHNVEWSAQIVLRHLANEGPMRASVLADSLQSDPSTVSRQVAALVKDGFVERQSDPEDGRASILVLTPLADEALAAHNQVRLDYFAAMLADWDERDLVQFADLLGRFTLDFEKSSSTFISERAATARPRPAEGKH